MLELIQDGEARFALAAKGQSEVLRAFDEAVMLDRIEAFLSHTATYWEDHKAAVEGLV